MLIKTNQTDLNHLDLHEKLRVMNIFTDCFSNEPSFRDMFSSLRRFKTTWIAITKYIIHKQNLEFHLAYNEKNEIIAFAAWIKPNTPPKSTFYKLIRLHFLSPLIVGPRSFLKMHRFSKIEAEILSKHSRMIILDVIAVHKNYQKNGVAKTLITKKIQENINCSFFVMTTNPRNRTIYEKLGFQLSITKRINKQICAYGLCFNNTEK